MRNSLLVWAMALGIMAAPIAAGAEGLAAPTAQPTATGYSAAFIDDNPDKPAWIQARDLDADGKPELVVSVFAGSSPMGAGYVSIYRQTADGSWAKSVLPGSEGIKFPNDTTIVDVDGDGDPDIILPSGFLATTPFSSGALAWFENKGGNGWSKHEIIVGQKLFYHCVEYVDIDGDGVNDMVTVAERKGASEVQYFKGKGRGEFVSRPVVLYANALGSIPSLVDLDRDGDLDIVCAEFFVGKGGAAWLENQGSGKWARHAIQEQVGPSIQFSLIPNLCGDGRAIGILANHVNSSDNPSGPKEGVFLLPVPTEPDALTKPWPGKLISDGIKSRKSPMAMPQGAPGVFRWGDPDGDGDIDIVVHGDGDPRVYLLEQVAAGQFETRVLLDGMAQGGVAVADLDGDGIDEIVASSYEFNKLAVLKRN